MKRILSAAVGAFSKRKPIVFSLVSNAGVTDGRVMKQAHSLKEAGYDVWVICRSVEGRPDKEVRDGVHFIRFACFDRSWSPLNSIHDEVCSAFGSEEQKIQDVSSRFRELQKTLGDVEGTIAGARAIIADLKGQSSLTEGPDERKTRRERIAEKEAELGMGLECRNLEKSFHLIYYFFALNLLRLNLDVRPDIIHSHDLIPLPAAVALARRIGAKVVFDAHELEAERAPPLPPERKQFVDRLETSLLTEVEQMIVVSNSIGDIYYKKFNKKRPVLIMNAPDQRCTSAVKDFRPDVRSMSGLTRSVPLVVYTGNVGLEARGVHKIVRAIALLPGYHLAILGPRKPRSDAWLQPIISECSVADRIHVLDPVPPEALVPALRSGDVGVCAFQDVSLNHRYALPNKLFEMAFGGLPLCVPNFPDMRQFVERTGIGRTMDERDPTAIAEAIADVYRNRDQYRPGEKAMAVLRAEYSWPVQANRLVEMYANIDLPKGVRNRAGAN